MIKVQVNISDEIKVTSSFSSVSTGVACDDATYVITDSALTPLYSGTVASGGTLNQQINDSPITVNGNSFANVKAEDGLNIPVRYENGTPVGTIVDGVVEIPNPTGGVKLLNTALHEWYRPNITDVGTTVTQVDTGSVGGLDLSNPDVASEPTVNSNTLGYDGVAQHLERIVANFRSGDASGVIHIKFKATDNTLNKNNFLFSAAKTSVNDLLNISYRNLKPRFAFQDFGVDVVILEANNPLVLNDVNTLTIFSTGTSIKMGINGVLVASSVIGGTNNGQWFHDITGGTDNIVLSGMKTTSNLFGKSDQYGVWYEPYTSDANVLVNGLYIQNNAI